MQQHSIRIVILLCLMVTVGRFALDSYLPSLPAINQYFHANSADTQMTLSVFLVGFSIAQLVYGALSDYYGRRKIILAGFIIFLFGTLMCTVATSLNSLLLARFIAGIGGGVTSSLKRAIAADTFKNYALVRISAMQSNAILITILIAPVIGGYIQHFYGWRINFLISFLYGLIIFSLLLLYFPNTRATIIAPQSLRIEKIMSCYYQVLLHKPFITNLTYSTCGFAGMVIFSQLSSFLLIDSLKVSSAHYGWLLASLAFSYLAAGIIVNRLVEKIGIKKLISIGIALLLLSAFILVIEYEIKYFTVMSVMLPAIIYVLGTRIIIPNAMARSISPFPTIAGYASAMMSMIQTLGAACGSYFISLYNRADLLPMTIAYSLLSCLSAFMFWYFELSKDARDEFAVD